MKEIVQIELSKVSKRLADREVSLEITPEATDYLIQKGWNQEMGARPLRRAVEQLLEDPLSEELLRGSFEGKKHVIVRLEGQKLTFDPQVSKKEEAAKPAEASKA